jgi:hypothetical protein
MAKGAQSQKRLGAFLFYSLLLKAYPNLNLPLFKQMKKYEVFS